MPLWKILSLYLNQVTCPLSLPLLNIYQSVTKPQIVYICMTFFSKFHFMNYLSANLIHVVAWL